MIMAGRAEPGWTVTVESGGKPVGQAVADSNGEWVIEPTRKLAKGEHSLELRAQNAEGGRTLFSKQRLALSLSDPKRDQPLVALTEEGKSTRVLQMPPPSSEQAEISVSQRQAPVEAAALSAPSAQSEKETAGNGNRVGFASVDYEEAGEKSMLHMSGQATPGTRIVLYIDNQFAGMATADATGSWSYSGNKLLTGGNHTLRADLLDKGTTKVTGRAEVKFDRAAPNTLARTDEDNTKLAAGVDNGASGSVRNVRRPATASAEPAAAAPLTLTDRNGAVIVVRSGDTLWQIAQRHYGDGAKYTQIFRSNRKQIRDPNWIYPSQRFELPQ
jgi:LysM repeat protein